jgi:putative SOS response-associated peptidase YedK
LQNLKSIMCGRFTLTLNPAQLMARFALDSADFVAQPRFNIAPTQTIAVVLDESPHTLSSARWGLVPSWAKDIAIGSRMINARAETLDEKPSFRTLLRRRRCLVLADGFYEWRRNSDGSKTPLRILMQDGAAFAMAGLWDVWNTPQGERLRICTIITTEPNSLAAQIHDRMPAILTHTAEGEWLNKFNDDPAYLKSLLAPYSAADMYAYPVSPRVNSVRNEGVELIAAQD